LSWYAHSSELVDGISLFFSRPRLFSRPRPGEAMMMQSAIRFLAVAAATAVVFATTAGQVGASPQKDSAGDSEGGVRITGTLTWKQFTPASQLIALSAKLS
jgi:hypothetical protein